MDDKHTDPKPPYADELAQLGVSLAELDEQAALELLEDMLDHVAATVSEMQSKDQPNKPLKQVMRECGLEG